jgi:hypothetical protein
MDQKIIEFASKWYSYDHYSSINQPPKHFNDWNTSNNLMMQYSKWIELESNCPSLKLDIDIPYKEMYVEAHNLIDDFIKHRENHSSGWRSLVIHGYNKHTTNDWNAEEYNFTEKPKYDWTEIKDKVPITISWLKEVFPFARYDRVRYMLLEPNGYIMPHKDFEIRKLAAYNVALNNPHGVEFIMEDGGMIPWSPGDVRAIDIGRYHCVRHLGTEPRIHMIIHGAAKDEFNRIICRSYDNLLKQLNYE